MAMTMEEINARINGLERVGQGNSQQPQQYQQYQQPQLYQQSQQEQEQLQLQHQQQQQQQLEADKQRVCNILIDWEDENFKKLSLTFVIDSLDEILRRPLAAEDQMYYKKKLRLVEKSLNPQQVQPKQTTPNFVSAEEMTNNKREQTEQTNNNHNKKHKK